MINYKTNEKEAESVAEEVGIENCLLVQADVSKEDGVKKLVKDTTDRFGKIDILVNNAGEIIRPGDWKTDIETWQKTIDVNLTSAWLMTKEVAPLIQKNGAIVNLTSTVGLLGSQHVLAYSCAKRCCARLLNLLQKS